MCMCEGAFVCRHVHWWVRAQICMDACLYVCVYIWEPTAKERLVMEIEQLMSQREKVECMN